MKILLIILIIVNVFVAIKVVEVYKEIKEPINCIWQEK